MALFGAPLAHEDHAVRACYAALRMQESVKQYAEGVFRAHGVPIQIRLGLNSGEVVVRAIGSDLHMDYTAVGQTTHLAARMEQMSTPGTITLAPATLQLAEGYIQVVSRGPVAVKGLPEPMEVYELTGASAVRSRLQAATARGLTKFVGRSVELDQLAHALERARAGRGQVIAIVGEPGVGKSRLAWEFTHGHRTQGFLIVESSSVSYGKATAFLPLIDLLRAYFQIEASDEARKIREKVTGKLLSLDRALESSLTGFLWLLDVPVEDAQWERLEPAQRRQQILDGIKRLLLRESQVQPLLILFEDLHWIDAETQALLDSLVESLPTARALLLVNYRPEYQHGWGGKTYYRQLRIDPLSPESAEDLLDGLLGNESGLQPLKRLLIERTEGNPFFLEESVRTLVETKVLSGQRGAYHLAKASQELQIPATARAILAARIDRLSPEDKRLLQAASVIGKDVPFTLLQAIADVPEEGLRGSLTRLQASEFLYEARLFPDLEYTFKHALISEVAYSSLLHDRRRVLHAEIMETIETMYSDRLMEQVERLAHHAFLGELREKAVHYLRQAGLKAAGRSALREAVAWFEQALGILDAPQQREAALEQAFEIRLELRPVLSLLGEGRRTLEHLREAEAVAERLNDDYRRGRIYAFMTAAHSVLGELDEALVTGARAVEIAQRLGDLRLHIPTTTYLELAHYYRGEYARVVELGTANLAALPAEWVYEHLGASAPPSVYDRVLLVVSLADLGRFAEATEYQAEAMHLAEPTRHAFTVGMAYRAAGVLHLVKGDWAKARSLLEHGIGVLGTGNVVILLPPAVAASAWVLAQLGEARDALNRLREGEQLVEREVARGIALHHAWAYHSLGRAALVLGRLDEARSLGGRAVESSPRQLGFVANALHLLGDVACHPDRFNAEVGEAQYRQALALAAPRGMRPLVAHCHFGLGRLYRRTGKRDEAINELTAAATMYREMGMAFWLEKADAERRGVG
jgi:tetratricopeptide (TPR) repeat protein